MVSSVNIAAVSSTEALGLEVVEASPDGATGRVWRLAMARGGGGKLEDGGLAPASCSLGGAVGSCPGGGGWLVGKPTLLLSGCLLELGCCPADTE